MKAIVFTRYGPPSVLHLREVEKPAPKDDEVLIRVRATSINSRDWRMMRANPFFLRFMTGGLLRPKATIPGMDAAGVIESVGGAVRQFKPGDEVFGYLSRYGGRTFAEYTCAGEEEIALKPSNCSFEQAAAVPLAAITALQALRGKGSIQPGQKVLVQGASGGVGTFAVQLAKAFGAEVTAVCSTRNVDMVRSLGADRVIDYKKADFTCEGLKYDLILAANGFHPLSHYLRSLNPGGSYVVAGGSMLQFIQAAALARRQPSTGGQKISVFTTMRNPQDILLIKDLLESGQLVPVIDACYPLDQAVDAFTTYEKAHARGKIVLRVE